MPNVQEPRGLPAELSGLGRCLVMSVLNVTPDSFSDGGRFVDPGVAVTHGIAQHRAGADIVDVGGESTRPGADRIPVDVELTRVLPVIDGLVGAGVPVSIDTMRSEVARAGVDHGAVLVNDVSGGQADDQMLPFVAGAMMPCVLMHWRGHSTDMQSRARYPSGVVAEVSDELTARLNAAEKAGVDLERVVLDPGLGFAKEPEHNWELLKGLDRLQDLDRPLLIGASRKRFLGELLATDVGVSRDLSERDDATVAVSALAAGAGVWCVRVHDSRGSADAVRVAAAWTGAAS